MGVNYAADKARYGASDARIRAAGKDKDKLLDAARKHPDRAKISPRNKKAPGPNIA